jgi:hypothetical protein
VKRQNKLSLPVQRKAATLIITLLLLLLCLFFPVLRSPKMQIAKMFSMQQQLVHGSGKIVYRNLIRIYRIINFKLLITCQLPMLLKCECVCLCAFVLIFFILSVYSKTPSEREESQEQSLA